MRSARLACLAVLVLLLSCSRNVGPPPADSDGPLLYEVTVSGPSEVPAGAVLFVGARALGGGPPRYVRRLERPRFPARVRLTETDALPMGGAPATAYVLFAYLDRDGNVSTQEAGDLRVESPGPHPLGTRVALRLRPMTTTSFRFDVTIEAPEPITGEGIVLVLLVRPEDRRPIAGAKLPLPGRWPLEVRFSEEQLYGPVQPGAELEVFVKVDRDGDARTEEPGDWFGRARGAREARVALRPAS